MLTRTQASLFIRICLTALKNYCISDGEARPKRRQYVCNCYWVITMEVSALIGSQLKRRADHKSARLWRWVLHQLRLTSSNLMALSIHQPDTNEVFTAAWIRPSHSRYHWSWRIHKKHLNMKFILCLSLYMPMANSFRSHFNHHKTFWTVYLFLTHHVSSYYQPFFVERIVLDEFLSF